MKKTTITISLLLAATLVAATERARFTPANASSVTITGSSTVHEWTMAGSTINGTIEVAPEIAADPAKAESWKSDSAALVTVKIPVANIVSDHDRMNRIMLDAMKASAFPEVRYDLIEATALNGTPDKFVVKTRGKLTVAGVTRDVEMNVTGVKNGEKRYVLTGDAPLKMTAFGIKPPTAMMGAIKSADDVKVTFRWVVDRSN